MRAENPRGLAKRTAAFGLLGTLSFIAGTATLRATRAPLAEGTFSAEATGDVLSALATHRTLALLSFLLHIGGLAGWLLYLPRLAGLLPPASRRLARTSFVVGAVLAMVGFVTASGAVWSLPAAAAAEWVGTAVRVGIIADVAGATLILVPGVGVTSFVARREDSLPRWLSVLGLTVAVLWGIHVLAIVTPLRGPTVAGAPLGLVWILATSIVLFRRGHAAQATVDARTP